MWTLIVNGHEHATFESLRKARLYAIRFFPNSTITRFFPNSTITRFFPNSTITIVEVD